MPIYEYKCDTCGEVFEKIEKFSDQPLTVHETCNGPVHRLISRSALKFKGSGWYVNDYAKSGAKSESTTNGSDKSDSGSESKSDSKSDPKSDSKSESKSDSKSESKSDSKSESKPAAKTESKSESPKSDTSFSTKTTN